MLKVEPLCKGTVLAEYQVVELLGQGSFGTTYLCIDNNLNRRCVVKEYTPHHLVERKGNGRIKAQRWNYRPHFATGLKEFLEEARRLGACRNNGFYK